MQERYYAALLDELWAFNRAIHFGYIRPTLYRHGTSYRISYVEFESGYLWYQCVALYETPYVHVVRVPHVQTTVIQGMVDGEWARLLFESGIPRHWLFRRR